MRLRRTRVLGVVLAIAMIATAAVGLRLSERNLGTDQDRAFEALRGRLGRPVAILGGTVEVTSVRVGAAYTQYGDDRQTSAGMIVVLTVVTANPGREQLQLARATLVTATRVYSEFPTSSGPTVDPGFVDTDDLAFEVDPHQIDDLTLELSHTELVTGYLPRAQIHLGITPANAAGWRAAAKDQTVAIAAQTRRAL